MAGLEVRRVNIKASIIGPVKMGFDAELAAAIAGPGAVRPATRCQSRNSLVSRCQAERRIYVVRRCSIAYTYCQSSIRSWVPRYTSALPHQARVGGICMPA